jgi:hypothetical protein
MSPLAQRIVSELKSAFPDMKMELLSVLSEGELFATIPPRWQDFGAITLHDDETEVMIRLGSFTHTHIQGTADEIAAEIVQLLRDTFSDRLVFWACGVDGMGGIDVKGEEPFWSVDQRPADLRRAIWSGPIEV